MAGVHREIESTFDVADDTALPDVADLPGVSRVDGPRTFRQEARYYDTDDVALGHAGITLRRRTGGEDDGWHLKLPVAGARQEIHAPLGRGGGRPPAQLRRIVRGVVRDRPVRHVATVVTERTLASLLDVDGSLLAELCDDRVEATGVKAGPPGEAQQWREWEVEIHAAPPSLVEALTSRMQEAGARRAFSRSKFGRAMGLDVDRGSHERPDVGSRATEHELLAGHLSSLRDQIRRLDPLARADVPDAVHQLRMAFRRMRAVLTSFHSCFETTATEPVTEELRWIGDVLGRPRDLEILRSRLSALLVRQPPRLVRGDPGPWLDSRLESERKSAHDDVLEAMDSDRFFSLADTMDSWEARPPWSDRPDGRAGKKLPKVLRREWARVEKAVTKVDAADDSERSTRLHSVRKRAKKARYAAETLQPVLGAEARDAAKAAKKIQRSLGAHHDTVVASERVLELAQAALDEGRDTFTFGVLSTRLQAELADQERAFRRVWKKV